VKSRTSTSGLKMRMTIFSPNGGGHRRDPELDLVAARRQRLDAAVLRPALLDDLHAAQQLDPRRDRREHGVGIA
jgi:hypothetical protein